MVKQNDTKSRFEQIDDNIDATQHSHRVEGLRIHLLYYSTLQSKISQSVSPQPVCGAVRFIGRIRQVEKLLTLTESERIVMWGAAVSVSCFPVLG